MSGPLRGVTVLEIAGIGPGPFACMMLADMGARVIRVDRIPAGRGGTLETMMRNDSIVDRGRESVAVNMKDPRGIEVVLRLVERADILVEGFRPGVMEKLGLGPADCMQRNPAIVYGRMTGWGQTGPLAQAAGHDLNYIAISGALHAMGPKDRPPAPPLNLVGDYGGGGMFLVAGVLAALHEVGRTGQGQVVDTAMSDGAAVLMAAEFGLMAKGAWRDERECNFLDGSAPFYATYVCSDGRYVALGPIEPQFYRELLQRCAIDDRRFARQWDVASWPELKAALAELFATRSRDEWCELLEGSDACFAPVLSMREAPEHPHNRARQTFDLAGGILQPNPAPRFSRTPSERPPSAPAIGRDTEALLREIGLGADDARDWIRDGVVYADARA